MSKKSGLKQEPNEQEIKIKLVWGKKEDRQEVINTIEELLHEFNFIKKFHISSDGKHYYWGI